MKGERAASGWSIFEAALTLLLGHFGAAVRLSVVPFGLVATVMLSILSTMGEWNVALPNISSAQAGSLVVAAIAYATAACWVAVAWHRRILLDEGGGLVPPFYGRAMWGYAWRIVVIFFILAIAGLVIGIPMSLLGLGIGKTIGGAGGSTFGLLVSAFVTNLVLGALFYTIALVLPARAVGRPIGFGDSMAAASGRFRALLLLAILTALFTLLLDLPATLDLSLGADLGIWAGFVLGLLVQWFVFMLGLSILTTLYAQLVEGHSA